MHALPERSQLHLLRMLRREVEASSLSVLVLGEVGIDNLNQKCEASLIADKQTKIEQKQKH